jgi:hypothetical protein
MRPSKRCHCGRSESEGKVKGTKRSGRYGRIGREVPMSGERGAFFQEKLYVDAVLKIEDVPEEAEVDCIECGVSILYEMVMTHPLAMAYHPTRITPMAC